MNTPEPLMFDWFFFILACNRTCITAWMGLNFNVRPLTRELSAPVLLIGSYSFLHLTRTTIRSRISSNFGQIRPWTAELDALEHLKKNRHRLTTGEML